MLNLLKTLLFIYLAIFPFGQLGRIELVSNVNLHLSDLTVGIIAALGIWSLAKENFRLPPLAYHFLAFLALALFSLLVNFCTVSPSQFFAGSLYFVRLAAYCVFYFVLWNLFQIPDGTWRVKIGGLLETIGIFIVFFGFIQYFFLPDLGLLAEYGWDPHLYRLAGSFLDTGFAGILIVLFLLSQITRISSQFSWISLLWATLGIIALALTYSRASYLAYFAGILAIYIVRRNIKWFLGVAGALVVAIALLPQAGSESVNLSRTSTVVYRVDNYKHALEVIWQSPLFGIGYNLYRYTQDDSASHGASGVDSSLLFLLATTGVCGLLVFAGLAWQVWKIALNRRNTVLGLSFLASFVAVGVHSLFDNSLFYPWVLGWLLILLASTENT